MIFAGPWGTFQYGEPFFAVTHSGTTLTVDVSIAPVTVLTLAASVTALTLTGWPGAGRVGTHTLQIVQSGAGSFTVAWDAAQTWGAAGAPTLSTAAGDFDLITLFTTDNGTVVASMVSGQGFN